MIAAVTMVREGEGIAEDYQARVSARPMVL